MEFVWPIQEQKEVKNCTIKHEYTHYVDSIINFNIYFMIQLSICSSLLQTSVNLSNSFDEYIKVIRSHQYTPGVHIILPQIWHINYPTLKNDPKLRKQQKQECRPAFLKTGGKSPMWKVPSLYQKEERRPPHWKGGENLAPVICINKPCYFSIIHCPWPKPLCLIGSSHIYCFFF